MACHLKLHEREVLYRLRQARKSPVEIAELLQRDPTTIRGELKWNSGQRGYRPQ